MRRHRGLIRFRWTCCFLVLLGAGLLLLTASTRGGSSTSFKFSTLDVSGLTSAVGVEAFAINSAGEIVGDDTTQGFLYQKAGRCNVLNIPWSGVFGSRAWGINDEGDIVGGFSSADGAHGYLRKGGTFTRIDVPGATDTSSRAINNRGEIVGDYIKADAHHFFLLKGGNFSTIEPPLVNPVLLPQPEALGINDSGHIVGYLDFFNPGLCHSGFIYADGKFKTIDVPGAKETLAQGINNHDQVVGYYTDGCTGYAAHGFLYMNGQFTRFDVPGAKATWPHGIDDAGRIVGTFDDASGSVGAWHAFIATPTP